MLQELCNRYRRNDGRYDVIVPGSGGKDSAFTSHILKYKYNMNPLTVTWAPHMYTDIGWRNFTNWMHEGGLDNILYTPNGKLHRHLTSLAVRNLMHPFQPFILGQRIIGPAMAKRFGVELVMYGENQAEYGNNVDENSIPTMNESFFSCEDPLEMMTGGVSVRDIIAEGEFSLGDFAPYIPPQLEELKEANVIVHYLGYYLKWDPQECYYYAVENTGFQVTQSELGHTRSIRVSMINHPFHYYTTFIKFGLGRASMMPPKKFVMGVTRKKASLWLKMRYRIPGEVFPEFLEYVGMEREEFFELTDKFRSPHLWQRSTVVAIASQYLGRLISA